MSFDITAIVSLHAEGRLCNATFQSVAAAISAAHASGLSVEWLVTADRVTADTKHYLDNHSPPNARVLALNSGDIASARNAGIEASSGNYISLLDGDDIWCENWLVDCHRLSEKTSYKNIFRPEVVITFEKKVEIQVCLDQESPHFKLESMVTDKNWPSTAFAHRDVYLNHPYRKPELASGVAFEDWSWSCDTIAAGFVHKIAHGTIFGARAKAWKDAMQSEYENEECMLLPNDLMKLKYQRAATQAT